MINVVTKGGSNGFHGRVYDYFQNDALNTVGYFKVPKPLPARRIPLTQTGDPKRDPQP